MFRKLNKMLLAVLMLAGFASSAFAWKFVSMADSRGSTNGVNTTVLTSIINLVKQENADLVIFQGDAVGGSATDSTLSSQMDTWLAIMNTLNCPWYFTPGNHELMASTSENIIRSKVNMPANGPTGYLETVWSFDHQNAHFVALNSNHYGETHHVQRSWLTTDLASTALPHVFVMSHEPAYPLGPHVGSSLDAYPTERDDFWNIISTKGVRMYFSGHEHFYARNLHGSVFEVLNGSCGAPLYTATGAISKYHYVVVDVNGYSISCQAKDNTGAVIDTWSYVAADHEPPTGTLSVNADAEYTRMTNVTLTLSATDPYGGAGVSFMQFSDDGSNWSTWEAYSTSKDYTLPSGEGQKTVYAKFKDASDNIYTGTISDGIILDTIAPTTTASPFAGVYEMPLNVTLTAPDSTAIYYTTDGSAPDTDSTTYSGQIHISESATLKFFAVDAAGNVETPIKEETYVISSDSGISATLFSAY